MVVGLTALDLHVFHVPSFLLVLISSNFQWCSLFLKCEGLPTTQTLRVIITVHQNDSMPEGKQKTLAVPVWPCAYSQPFAKACCNAIRSANLSDIRLNGQVITFFFLPWCFPTLLRTLRKESEKRNKNMNYSTWYYQIIHPSLGTKNEPLFFVGDW